MAHDEQRGEDLRLLTWRSLAPATRWYLVGGAKDSEHSPLGRLLMSRDAEGKVLASGKFAPKDAEVHRRLEEVAARTPGFVSVERCAAISEDRWQGLGGCPGELRVARFDRPLDLVWRRTSYTAITAPDLHREPVGSEPEDTIVTDEPEESRLAEAPGRVAPTAAGPSSRPLQSAEPSSANFLGAALRWILLGAALLRARPSSPAPGRAALPGRGVRPAVGTHPKLETRFE